MAWAASRLPSTPTDAIAAIHARTFRGIALVVASGQGIGASTFGHTFLRLMIDPNQPSADDWVIQLGANTQGTNLSYLRGIGIGAEPYEFKGSITTYAIIMEEKLLRENRSLHNLVLRLDPAELEAVHTAIRGALVEPMPAYRFFTFNCASASARILANGLGAGQLDAKATLPSRLAARLHAAGRVAREFTDRDYRTIRAGIVEKLLQLPEIQAVTPGWRQAVGNALAGASFRERLPAFLLLHAVTRASQTELLQAFFWSLATLENEDNRRDLATLQKGAGQPRYTLISVPGRIAPRVREGARRPVLAIARAADDTPLLTVGEWRLRSHGPKGSTALGRELVPLGAVPMPDFVWQKDWLLWDGIRVARWLPAPLSTILDHGCLPFAITEPTSGETREHLRLYMIVDRMNILTDPTLSRQPPLPSDDDLLTLIPPTALHRGACIAMVALQKGLLESAVFLPASARHDDEAEYARTIDFLYQGYVALIPGFGSPREFSEELTSSAYHAAVAREERRLNAWRPSLRRQLTARPLGSADFECLSSLLELGIRIPLTLDLAGRSNHHMVLLLSLDSATGEGWVFDPNLGLMPVRLQSTEGTSVTCRIAGYQIRKALWHMPSVNHELARRSLLRSVSPDVAAYFSQFLKTHWLR